MFNSKSEKLEGEQGNYLELIFSWINYTEFFMQII